MSDFRLAVVALAIVSMAIYHWLVRSLHWLFDTAMTFFYWLGASLRIAEHSFLYGFGIVIVILLAMLILLVGLSSRIRDLESQNRELYQQNADLQSQQHALNNQFEEDRRARRVQSIVNGALKVGHFFLGRD